MFPACWPTYCASSQAGSQEIVEWFIVSNAAGADPLDLDPWQRVALVLLVGQDEQCGSGQPLLLEKIVQLLSNHDSQLFRLMPSETLLDELIPALPHHHPLCRVAA